MMKRTLAITAVTVLTVLSLAACGAGGGMETRDGVSAAPGGTTATDTMRNDNGMTGTGTAPGATTNGTAANNGLGGVTGAVNRATGWNDSLVSGRAAKDNTTALGRTVSTPVRTERDAQASADRYVLMLENGRVHDTDGFLLDGENAHYRTF